MNLRRAGIAGVALACALCLGTIRPIHAQEAGAQSSYDSQSWQAPRGYDEAYPENGQPNMVARQGYAAGFNEGQADAARGKKFEPTANKAYEKAVIPKGMDKNQFKQDFREAFVKGYSNGYKGQS
jgi:hypothetical protein